MASVFHSLSGLPLLLGHKINHSALTIALLSAVILNIGCESADPAVEVPAYISVTAFNLQTDYATEGTDDHNISDVWVLVGDQDVGAYELPAVIPVIASGSQEVHLLPGIKVNGISSTRDIYNFIDGAVSTETLVPGSTVSISPKVNYYSDITFEWLEDFEIGSTLQKLSISDTDITVESVTSLPAMGSKSGVIHVDATNDYYIGATNGKQFVLPLGLPVFIELNYASTIEFSIGAIKKTTQGAESLSPFFNIFPSGDWNKIYIDLTPYLQSHVDALSFEIYFTCTYDPTVPVNRVLLDNIKLIYQ
ncbi:MAG TPA: hypothetical protein EYN71_01100 [Flavobacteriales bacterium]|nr:hypothetical protein [Flavobacteriales bacterium]HIO68309.1 hypothetical protein [Flavobacteriales bacterium]